MFLHHVLKCQPHPVPSPIEHIGAPSHEPAAEHATLRDTERETEREGREKDGARREARQTHIEQQMMEKDAEEEEEVGQTAVNAVNQIIMTERRGNGKIPN